MLKEQNHSYIDSGITNVFHFLELKSNHNFLIGSKTIRNMLYSNDYDLNSNIQIHDTKSVLKSLYKEFLDIFNTAYKNPEYYILDFKCGVHNGEAIRWSYADIKKGSKNGMSFEECLLMDDDNLIKLDLCYVKNGVEFTDINCIYNLYIVNDKKQYEKEKDNNNKEIKQRLKDDIKQLEKDGQYYKALKRYFSLSIVSGKVDKMILKTMNSDFGMYYKFISFLNLCLEMLTQKFKPIELSLIRSNLESIKQFGSSITAINIDEYLDKLVKVIAMSKPSMTSHLEKLIETCGNDLDKRVNKEI
jgi:hypothetical protein